MVQRFFQEIAPLSPVLTDFFQNHANHYTLVTQEPLLCCVILTISSRYHNLPGVGGVSRGYHIHDRLWSHCQHMLIRIVLGQEKSSKARTRTLGTIEALLLLTEWHPRALHFPPPADGWDSDLMLTAVDERDEDPHGPEPPSRGRWLEDVINPAKRSDRMSWMLIGCAMSLAYELRIFDQSDSGDTARGSSNPREERRSEQIARLQKLLYLYAEQASLRLGCKSVVPQGLYHTVAATVTASKTPLYGGTESWQHFMASWIELTKLVRSMTDVLFPSLLVTKHLLTSGRYVNLVEHFQPLLSAWKERNLTLSRELCF